MELDKEMRDAIVRQVEHYLSLGNLATDFFLRSQMSACASGFMGVPLSLLASFPRIRSLCPVGEGTAKSRDDVIADILLDSKDVLVENQQVRRRDGVLPPLEHKSEPSAKRMRTAEIVVSKGSQSKDLRSPDKSVYVGNLSPLVTDVLLFELFSQVGPVDRVTLPLTDDVGGGGGGHALGGERGQGGTNVHRGYAFVQFADGAVNGAGHSCTYAISVMHDLLLFDRRITVRRSLSTHNQARMGEEIWKHTRILPGDVIPSHWTPP